MFTEPMDTYSLNLGLIIGNRHIFVIDTGLGSNSVAPVFEYLSGDLRNDVKQIVVVNTHFHWDHVWGNWMFDKNVIISHKNCRALMEKFWDADLARCAAYIDGQVHKRLPDLVFDHSLYFPDDNVRVFYTPGHTSDCVSVYDEVDKVLYAGDNIGDTPENILPEIETDTETFMKTLAVYGEIDFKLCVSGHNQPLGRDIIPRLAAEINTQRPQL
jgi:glyoxylase-like metal-dependent hydrolase (beta-lactamase superfamily II)